MELPRLKIRNIKISLILQDDLQNQINKRIVKHGNAVLTFYPSSKRLINVTKLERLEQLYKIKSEVESLYNVKVEKLRVDAIMLSRKVENRRFSEKKILKTMEKYHHLFRRDYEQELFHSPWFKSTSGRNGSFNIFTNGSATIMGAKSVEDIKVIEEMLDEVFCKDNEINNLT